MKKYIVVFGLILSFSAFGQNDSLKLSNDEKMDKAMEMLLATHNIEMDVDNDIYPVSEGNNYFTTDQRAGITASLMPFSYEKLKLDMENEKDGDGRQILDMGEIDNLGIPILYMKQKLQKGDEIFIMYMYCKKIDDDACLAIGGFFENGKEHLYTDEIKEAAISAELIK